MKKKIIKTFQNKIRDNMTKFNTTIKNQIPSANTC